MKTLQVVFASLLALLLFAAMADAQSFHVYFGMGTAHDGSNGKSLDILNTGTPLPTGAIDGVFGTIGGGFMFRPTLGVGGEVSFRFAQGDYAGVGDRPIFYDFNGIWAPTIGTKRVRPEFQAGLGGLNLRFYGGGQYFDPYTGQYTDFLGSYNHFQLHAGAGLRFYVSQHIFVRPQFDYHWVHNLTDQFSSNSVPAWSVAIGFDSRE